MWLPIRPGTDAALLLTWTRWILENEKYDAEFCRTWTNMPYLINPETRLTLKATEAGLPGTDADYVVWDPEKNAPVVVEFPHERGTLPGAVRHLRSQRHAVRHGRPASEGVLRGVDA